MSFDKILNFDAHNKIVWIFAQLFFSFPLTKTYEELCMTNARFLTTRKIKKKKTTNKTRNCLMPINSSKINEIFRKYCMVPSFC